MKKEEKKEVNYYKYTTFAFIVVFVVCGFVYGINVYAESRFEEGVLSGEQSVMFSIVNSIVADGYVSFTDDNVTLTLVPINQIGLAREKALQEVINVVNRDGAVTLYTNNTQLVLVPYESFE